jgi:hypothetical protein
MSFWICVFQSLIKRKIKIIVSHTPSTPICGPFFFNQILIQSQVACNVVQYFHSNGTLFTQNESLFLIS